MKNKNLISISGKKGSGKDTVGKIIQLLANKYKTNEIVSLINNNARIPNGGWHIKRWADALKQVCSIILGVPVSKFEDQEFKASELGEEWWSWNVVFGLKPVAKYNTKEEALQHISDAEKRVHYFEELRPSQVLRIEQVKPTVRWLLQNLGTEVGRNIHPNMWVNILMNKYKGVPTNTAYRTIENIYPQWIITDTRFENELQAVQDRNGICVKVERDNDDARITYASEKAHKELISEYGSEDYLYQNLLGELREYKDEVQDKFNELYDKYEQEYLSQQHKSETSLDHIKEWDWVFNNNGSIEELVEQVKEFLTHFKII